MVPGLRAAPPPTTRASPASARDRQTKEKRTNRVLSKPDNSKSYRQRTRSAVVSQETLPFVRLVWRSGRPSCCPYTTCMGPPRVKRFVGAFSIFFRSVSLFDSESRFSAPTHRCAEPSRAGAVKDGRRAGHANHQSLPGRSLMVPSTRACLWGSGRRFRGEPAFCCATKIAPHTCIRWAVLAHTHDAIMRIGERSSEAADPFFQTA